MKLVAALLLALAASPASAQDALTSFIGREAIEKDNHGVRTAVRVQGTDRGILLGDMAVGGEEVRDAVGKPVQKRRGNPRRGLNPDPGLTRRSRQGAASREVTEPRAQVEHVERQKNWK